MDINKAPARQYAFTLRRTNLKQIISPETYFQHVEKWTNAGICTIIDSVFEQASGLHMHGIIEIPKHVPMRRFRVRGWNIKLDELYNEEGWRYYMLKDQLTNEENEEYIEDNHNLYNLSYSLFKNRCNGVGTTE